MQKATRDPLVIRFQSEVVKMAQDSIRFQSEVVKMARESNNYCRLNLFHSVCKRFLMQCVSKYLCPICAKYYISFVIHDIICSTTFSRSLYCAIILRTIDVRIVTCIAQVNMQAYWDLPKPSNYSHDVLQPCYRIIACVGIIINLV